jgi:hypothetical protein
MAGNPEADSVKNDPLVDGGEMRRVCSGVLTGPEICAMRPVRLLFLLLKAHNW